MEKAESVVASAKREGNVNGASRDLWKGLRAEL